MSSRCDRRCDRRSLLLLAQLPAPILPSLPPLLPQEITRLGGTIVTSSPARHVHQNQSERLGRVPVTIAAACTEKWPVLECRCPRLSPPSLHTIRSQRDGLQRRRRLRGPVHGAGHAALAHRPHHLHARPDRAAQPADAAGAHGGWVGLGVEERELRSGSCGARRQKCRRPACQLPSLVPALNHPPPSIPKLSPFAPPSPAFAGHHGEDDRVLRHPLLAQDQRAHRPHRHGHQPRGPGAKGERREAAAGCACCCWGCWSGPCKAAHMPPCLPLVLMPPPTVP